MINLGFSDIQLLIVIVGCCWSTGDNTGVLCCTADCAWEKSGTSMGWGYVCLGDWEQTIGWHTEKYQIGLILVHFQTNGGLFLPGSFWLNREYDLQKGISASWLVAFYLIFADQLNASNLLSLITHTKTISMHLVMCFVSLMLVHVWLVPKSHLHRQANWGVDYLTIASSLDDLIFRWSNLSKATWWVWERALGRIQVLLNLTRVFG